MQASLLPPLIEQIFENYTKKLAENSGCIDEFFLELRAVLGEVLVEALRLLDEQTITIYMPESKIRAIAEITEGRNSPHVTKLFLDINYCGCAFFAQNVLTHASSYTCQHVLALKLATLVKAPGLRTEILPKHKFNYLLLQMNAQADNS